MITRGRAAVLRATEYGDSRSPAFVEKLNFPDRGYHRSIDRTSREQCSTGRTLRFRYTERRV